MMSSERIDWFDGIKFRIFNHRIEKVRTGRLFFGGNADDDGGFRGICNKLFTFFFGMHAFFLSIFLLLSGCPLSLSLLIGIVVSLLCPFAQQQQHQHEKKTSKKKCFGNVWKMMVQIKCLERRILKNRKGEEKKCQNKREKVCTYSNQTGVTTISEIDKRKEYR